MNESLGDRKIWQKGLGQRWNVAEAAHQKCLDGASPTSPRGTTCSKIECQELHNRKDDASSMLDTEMRQCRGEVHQFLDAEAREKADQDARQQEQRQDAAETRPHHTFDLTRDEIEQEARAAMRFEREHDALQRNLKSAQDERSKSGAGIVAGISSTASYSGLRDSVAAVSGMMDRLGAGDSAGKLLLAIPDSWLLGQAVPSLSSSSVPRALFMESVKAEMQTMDDVCVAIKDFGSPGHESRISFDDNVARFREALSPQVALAATLGTAAEKTRETLEIFGYMPYDPEEVENNPLLKYPLSYADFRLGVEVQELSQPALLRIFPVLPEQKVKDKIYKSWAIQE